MRRLDMTAASKKYESTDRAEWNKIIRAVLYTRREM